MNHKHAIPILNDLLPIIYPQFFVQKNTKGEELIFLKQSDDQKLEDIEWDSNTECEALHNHFHLFDKAGVKNRKSIEEICFAIVKNLNGKLSEFFPDKSFITYLDINLRDSVIIRFHQVWDNEPLYYENVSEFNSDTQKIYEFFISPVT